MNKRIIYQGAEAKICVDNYLKKEVISKKRIKKSYRIEEIDSHLIFSRTKEEAKLISEARTSGISVPLIYDVDVENGIIFMQYLKGKRIKDILNDLNKQERRQICNKIGKNIAKLHNYDIIHGDITTSNMILHDNRIYFFDFGLGCKDSEAESKGVDLHVLMEAFESTHSKYGDCFDYVLEGYKQEFQGNFKEIVKKIKDIVKRGRYR